MGCLEAVLALGVIACVATGQQVQPTAGANPQAGAMWPPGSSPIGQGTGGGSGNMPRAAGAGPYPSTGQTVQGNQPPVGYGGSTTRNTCSSCLSRLYNQIHGMRSVCSYLPLLTRCMASCQPRNTRKDLFILIEVFSKFGQENCPAFDGGRCTNSLFSCLNFVGQAGQYVFSPTIRCIPQLRTQATECFNTASTSGCSVAATAEQITTSGIAQQCDNGRMCQHLGNEYKLTNPSGGCDTYVHTASYQESTGPSRVTCPSPLFFNVEQCTCSWTKPAICMSLGQQAPAPQNPTPQQPSFAPGNPSYQQPHGPTSFGQPHQPTGFAPGQSSGSGSGLPNAPPHQQNPSLTPGYQQPPHQSPPQTNPSLTPGFEPPISHPAGPPPPLPSPPVVPTAPTGYEPPISAGNPQGQPGGMGPGQQPNLPHGTYQAGPPQNQPSGPAGGAGPSLSLPRPPVIPSGPPSHTFPEPPPFSSLPGHPSSPTAPNVPDLFPLPNFNALPTMPVLPGQSSGLTPPSTGGLQPDVWLSPLPPLPAHTSHALGSVGPVLQPVDVPLTVPQPSGGIHGIVPPPSGPSAPNTNRWQLPSGAVQQNAPLPGSPSSPANQPLGPAP